MALNSLKLKMRVQPLFVDKHVIVISKPSGVISQIHGKPSPKRVKFAQRNNGRNDEALELILDDLVDRLKLGSRPTPVHRLDKNTTGTFLLARTPNAAKELSQQLSSRTIQKTYLALVRAGKETFKTTSGQIEENIRYVDGRPSIDKNGIPALTSWNLLQSSPVAPVSLLKLTLHTGLKHQLRVHLAHSLQAPILGDTLHSLTKPSSKITNMVNMPDDRLFLHASQISFTRYRKVAPKKYLVNVAAPLPKDFLAICHRLGLKLDPRDVRGGVLVNGENASSDLVDFESWWACRSGPTSS